MRRLVLAALLAAAVIVQAARAQEPAPPAAAEPEPAAPDPVARYLERYRQLPPSLMFTEDEATRIREAMAKRPASSGHESAAATADEPVPDQDKDKPPPKLDTNLTLSGIMFFGANDWTVWINGIPHHPDTKPPGFDIVAVTPDHVDLAVPWGIQGKQAVRMEPNQTFVATLGQVVEGPTQ